MKSSEILELIRAGYTKAEIQAIDAAPAADPTPAPAADPTPAKPAPAADPVPATEPAPAPDWQQQLFTQLGALTAAIQGQNLAQAEMGAQIIEPYAAGVNTLRGLVNIPNKEEK